MGRVVAYYVGMAILAYGSGGLVAWAFPHQTIWSLGLSFSVGTLVGYLYGLAVNALIRWRSGHGPKE